jgi:glycosyltransferase involved in cell wall biosynthesis
MARVTFGLPVYNGEAYLARALETLLGQDYQDFEVHVSDNCSSDGTRAIVADFATRDPRVRYSRNDSNIGGTANFNRVFERASSELFAWAGHDDEWQPTFLGRCVAALDARPDAVLAHPWVRFIDLEGRPLPEQADDFLDERLDRGERFRAVIQDQWGPLCVYGLMRASALRRTRRFQPLLGGDVVLLAELALLGPFVQVREPLWTYRTAGFTQGEAYVERTRASLKLDRRVLQRVAPWLRLCLEYLRVVASSELPVDEKLRLARHVLRWYGVDALLLRHGRVLLQRALGDEKLAALLEALREQPWYRRWRRIRE